MFATHYHALSREFAMSPVVQLRHMAAAVAATTTTTTAAATAATTDDDEGKCSTSSATVEKPITFLYKLRPGACPKSYGMQVAELAGVPGSVLAAAKRAAAAMEKKLSGVFGTALTAELTVGERSALTSVIGATGTSGTGSEPGGSGSGGEEEEGVVVRRIEPLWRDLQRQRSTAAAAKREI